jgi:hypothetical protein
VLEWWKLGREDITHAGNTGSPAFVLCGAAHITRSYNFQLRSEVGCPYINPLTGPGMIRFYKYKITLWLTAAHENWQLIIQNQK